MRRLVIFIACLILLPIASADAQQADGNVILGNWLTEDGKAVVEVYKCGDQYCGKIIWLKEPNNEDGTEKLDSENPDPPKRNRKIIGLNIVWGFRYDGKNKWVDGNIYDPDNGKTYSCKMNFKGDELKVRGYIGFSLIGRTTIWRREQ
jgi:uncharacterized protein (DUF2147 family)